MMASKKAAAALAIIGLLTTGGAWAQDYGERRRGLELAAEVCAGCHAVRPGEESTNPLAPAFSDIADSPGMSEMALSVALNSHHRDMPNLVLNAQERADIIAYIISLRGSR